MNRGSWDKTSGSLETAAEAIKRLVSFTTFSTGSKNLDALIGGGCRGGTITLLYGRSNSGKTQVAMQSAMLCARTGKAALFVDTEGSFRPERVEEMAKARKLEQGGILNRIVYVRCDSVSEQMETIRMMPTRGATAPAALVVVDTLTRNFSLEFPGRSNLSSRQGALNVHLSEMARDAYLNGRAYLLTNRVTFGNQQDVGIGGRTVDQLVHMTVLLEKEGVEVKATDVSSGKHASAEVGAFGVD
jgi:DNA repair protein RadA